MKRKFLKAVSFHAPARLILFLLIIVTVLSVCPESFAQQFEEPDYRSFPIIGSRNAIWVVAQLHLFFAAFVLAVPIFALIIEFIGYKTGEKRYDDLAHEFTKLLSVSFSLTASLGAVLTFMLVILYPRFTKYFVYIFEPTFFYYVLLFFFEAFFLYAYYYGWGKFSPKLHLALGVGLNVVGTMIMLIANGWVTFMTSPAGIDADTGKLLNVWDAVMNFTWMPINIHRLIANVAFGGSVAAAYGAYKFLGAKTDAERAQYDWMGYIGNFIAISAFLPLPFAGYWLGKEIYAYSQNLGMTLMGGAFSWLFIIQAILIGNLFLSANLYLWLGMGRIPGAERFRPFIKYLLIAIIICFAVWATPNSILATVDEVRAMGGSQHPILKFMGVMSAKNTAVNILILTTYISFLLYRRGNKETIENPKQKSSTAQLILTLFGAALTCAFGYHCYSLLSMGFEAGSKIPHIAYLFSYGGAAFFAVMCGLYFLRFFGARLKGSKGLVSWHAYGSTLQILIFVATVAYVVWIGIYGYFVPTKIRIGMSVPQVLSVLSTMILVTVVDVLMLRSSKESAGIQWGKMSALSQYCLFFTAITFTWLMGLMGYVRSGLRQHWHVYGIMPDKSPDAYTPTLGYASTVVSITVIIFFLMVAFVFWLASLTGKKDYAQLRT